MTNAALDDPKNPNVKPKIACVIPVFIVSKNYGHYTEDKLETLTLNLKAHKHFKAGVDYDIILVDHGGCPDLPYTTLNMPNEGYSFGAYKQAWETFGDKYDYYLFTEDDIAPAKDGWLAEIVLKFLSDKTIGAVGNYVEGRSSTERGSETIWKSIDYQRDMMYNLDGCFTFTSSKILKDSGMLVLPCEPSTKLPATVNECIFQLPILELGYRIVSFENRYTVHGSEVFTGNVENTEGEIYPLVNLNGRRKIPHVKEIFAPIL